MTQQNDIVALIPVLRSYAWALTRRHEDADDLVQETLLKAIGKIDSFQSGTNLRAWLMTIMRNTFLNEIAKAKKSATGKTDCVSTTLATPATQDWTVRGGELMDAVARLPLHYRETLVAVVMLGESYESAARMFGIQMGTVKSRVHRARAMVVEDLESRAPNDPARDAPAPERASTLRAD